MSGSEGNQHGTEPTREPIDAADPAGTPDESRAPEDAATQAVVPPGRGVEEAAIAAGQAPPTGEAHYIERFDVYSRFLHLLIIISFLSLAVTGMVIKFSESPVFQALAMFLGGYQVTGFIHRVSALITFLYFFLHIRDVLKRKRASKATWKEMLSGEDTLAPRMEDLREFGQTIRWFVGKGPKPNYGRWTYFEKFDYLAVFWGVAIIGSSGLILWFPTFFTSLGLPGWFINIATIIHSDEALLAVGFIFTIHFFNTHFRPDKFPIDIVMFTGRLSLREFRRERPREYEQLLQEGKLQERLVSPPSKKFVRGAKIFGFIALSIGVITILMIIYSAILLVL